MLATAWAIDKNGDAARAQVERNSREDQRRDEVTLLNTRRTDCVRGALSGVELKETSMAGVEHAEATAHLMASIRDTLIEFAPTSQATARIVPEVDTYIAGVAEFRRIAEAYQPRDMAECRDIGAGVLEPLPVNPTVSTTIPGG